MYVQDIKNITDHTVYRSIARIMTQLKNSHSLAACRENVKEM